MTAGSDDAAHGVDIGLLFVYGTLLPGEERWAILQPFVTDEGIADTVAGRLFDTGEGYPAASFTAITGDGVDGVSPIAGRVFELVPDTAAEALEVLDEVEDIVLGLYRRVALVTDGGRWVWAYQYGSGLTVTPIASGDWVSHIRAVG